jgi:hypothetical protein
MLVLGSPEVTMARLIPFYVPQNFKPPKKQGQPVEQQGKIIEFQSASIKKSA